MVNRASIGQFIVKKRSIVPNIITMLNMTLGFFAIIYAARGDANSLAIAGVLIFIGSLCDASDGAVARAMHVESPVGLQLDSLADGIAYGIAPAVIAYQAFLSKLPEVGSGVGLGMIIAPIYPICAIYRLARFNVESEEEGKGGFTGLPSPAAGIVVSAVPTLFPVLPFFGNVQFLAPVAAFLKSNPFFVPLYLFTAFLMVSHVDYSKLFYDIYKKGRIATIITVLLIIILLIFFRMWSVFAVTMMYIVLGMIGFFIKIVLNKSKHDEK